MVRRSDQALELTGLATEHSLRDELDEWHFGDLRMQVASRDLRSAPLVFHVRAVRDRLPELYIDRAARRLGPPRSKELTPELGPIGLQRRVLIGLLGVPSEAFEIDLRKISLAAIALDSLFSGNPGRCTRDADRWCQSHDATCTNGHSNITRFGPRK